MSSLSSHSSDLSERSACILVLGQGRLLGETVELRSFSAKKNREEVMKETLRLLCQWAKKSRAKNHD
jgi:hypothetical protein